jgi:hypothetical protein
MIGTTTDEFRGTMDPATPIDDDRLLAMLGGVLGRKDTGDGAREALAAYRRDEPDFTNGALFGEVFTHYSQIRAIKSAEAKLVGGGAPVYSYLFAVPPALHCAELAYLFRWGVEDALADEISDTWLAFARYGDQQQSSAQVADVYSRPAGHNDPRPRAPRRKRSTEGRSSPLGAHSCQPLSSATGVEGCRLLGINGVNLSGIIRGGSRGSRESLP